MNKGNARRGRGGRLVRIVSGGGALALLSLLLAGAPACGSGSQAPPAFCTDFGASTVCGAGTEFCRPEDGCSHVPACTHDTECGVPLESLCEGTPECHWGTTGCVLPVDLCPALSLDACASTPHCFVDQKCVGQLKSCDSLNQTECQMIPHCTWYSSLHE
jgi:hypothetical protein